MVGRLESNQSYAPMGAVLPVHYLPDGDAGPSCSGHLPADKAKALSIKLLRHGAEGRNRTDSTPSWGGSPPFRSPPAWWRRWELNPRFLPQGWTLRMVPTELHALTRVSFP